MIMIMRIIVFGLFASEAKLSGGSSGYHATGTGTAIITAAAAAAVATDHEKRCEEITVPMCRNIGYNSTSMPNQFHHDSQDEAGLEGE